MYLHREDPLPAVAPAFKEALKTQAVCSPSLKIASEFASHSSICPEGWAGDGAELSFVQSLTKVGTGVFSNL